MSGWDFLIGFIMAFFVLGLVVLLALFWRIVSAFIVDWIVKRKVKAHRRMGNIILGDDS